MIGMPLPVVPGGAPVGVPGAPPPGGPSGDMPVAAGFDALFQQLTGRAFAAALTPGATAPAGEGDGDGEADASSETDVAAASADAMTVAAVPGPVAVVPTPVEWAWTQPVPAPVDGPPAGEGSVDGAPVPPSPIGDVGPGSIGAAQPVARRDLSGGTPVFSPVAAPAGREETPVAAPAPRPGGSGEGAATAETPAALPVALTASPVSTTLPAEISGLTVPANPVPADLSPTRPGPVDAAPVGPPAIPVPAPPSDIAAAPEARPEGPVFAPLPGAPGGDRGAETRAAGEVRQGRARAVAPEMAAPVAKETPGGPNPAAFAVPTDAATPAAPVRRPLPAGALAAMERLAATPATPTGAAAAATAPVRAEVSPNGSAAPAAQGHGGSSAGEGFGARREGSQPAPERIAAGASFRLADTPAAALSVGAPGLERAAMGDPLAPSVEMAHVGHLEPALADSVHQQIVRSIRMQWSGGLGEARVSLKPEFLGEVTASINVERGVVTATLHADTPEVRAFMESHAATLRDALVEHGLRLDRLEVAEPERDAQTPDRQPGRRRGQQEAPPKPRRREPESGATFDFVSE